MIKLESGKTIEVKERTGATHMVENRLLAKVIPRGSSEESLGMNLGDFSALADVKAAVGIKSIDNRPIKTPYDLAALYELMSEFTYDEWTELKSKINPTDKETEQEAKNLVSSNGLEAE